MYWTFFFFKRVKGKDTTCTTHLSHQFKNGLGLLKKIARTVLKYLIHILITYNYNSIDTSWSKMNHCFNHFPLSIKRFIWEILLFCSPQLKAQVSFLIPCCLSSVCLSVRLFVNFSHFHLLLQNHWANFDQSWHQTWHKASLGKGVSSLFSLRSVATGDWTPISRIWSERSTSTPPRLKLEIYSVLNSE